MAADPTPELRAKAARLVAQGRVRWSDKHRCFEVKGDSGTTYQIRVGGMCPCPAHTQPCSHVLAVEEYRRREKEQTMPEQTEPPKPTDTLPQVAPAPPRAAMVTAQTQAMTPQVAAPLPEMDYLERLWWVSEKMALSSSFAKRRKQYDPVTKAEKWITEPGDPADIFSIVLAGLDFGLSPSAASRHLHMVGSALSISAEIMRARLHQFGYEYELEISKDIVHFPLHSKDGKVIAQGTGPKSVTVTLWRRNDPSQKWSATYLVDEAVTAGLTMAYGGYQKNPEDMLIARATTRVVRRYAPEVLNKSYLPEELGIYEESDGQEGTRLVQMEIDGERSSILTPAPAHDADTGEVIPDADFTVDPEPGAVPAANGQTHAMTPDRSAPAPAETEGSTDAECREAIAEEWHWPAVPEQRCREVMGTLGYTTEQADAEIVAVTNDIMLRALVARLKGALAEHQAQQSAGMDFDDYERTDSGRVDEPLPEDAGEPDAPEGELPFGDEPAPVPEGVQPAPPATPPTPTVTLEQAEQWVAVYASADAAVDGSTVPDELVPIIARKDSWRKYMMEVHGYGFGEQEQLMRGFELGSDPGKLTRGQRLGLIWWAELHGKGAHHD